jgi:uncharacterized protein with HEPN domain
MRDHMEEAIQLVQGKSRTDLDQDRLLNLALVRLCEIIGEAASKIPRETQERYAQVPWPQIVGFRNRLIHGYDSVDFDILWQVLTSDLPSLLTAIDQVMAEGTG